MLNDAITRDGKLYVPVEWFCAALFNWHVSGYAGSLYATDHYAHLSRYAEWVLSDILLDKEQQQRGMKK